MEERDKHVHVTAKELDLGGDDGFADPDEGEGA